MTDPSRPAPPDEDQPGNRKTYQAKAVAGAAAVLVVVAGAALFTHHPPAQKVVDVKSAVSATTVPQATPATGPISPPAVDTGPAQEQADTMVDALTLPPGSERVSNLPGQFFSEPNQSPACTPLVFSTRFWTVSGAPEGTWTYFKQHAPSWIPFTMGAEPTALSPPPNAGPRPASSDTDEFGVAGIPTRAGYAMDELVVTIGPAGNGETGIRADGMAVPAGGGCTSSGPGPSVPGSTTSGS